MTVLFEHNSNISYRMVLHITEPRTNVVFIDGVFQTTDKDVVKSLLGHGFYKRGKFKMVTDKKLVNNWLENDEEPSYLTKDQVYMLSKEALEEFGVRFNSPNKGFPELIRSEIIGMPVSDDVQLIIDKYTKKTKTTTAEKKPARGKVIKPLEEKTEA